MRFCWTVAPVQGSAPASGDPSWDMHLMIQLGGGRNVRAKDVRRAERMPPRRRLRGAALWQGPQNVTASPARTYIR